MTSAVRPSSASVVVGVTALPIADPSDMTTRSTSHGWSAGDVPHGRSPHRASMIVLSGRYADAQR
jgi:hypothetical protein